MRVIAGEVGGRKLSAPGGRATRPTSDRAREAIFSMLTSLGAGEGQNVWDLFCGSGALGIEALSRGAAHVTFVDSSRSALAATRANLAHLGYGGERAEVVAADALAWVAARPGTPPCPEVSPSLLVMADPPYSWDQWPDLLAVLAAHQPLLVMETGRPPAGLDGWDVIRSKQYGGAVVTLARPTNAVAAAAGTDGAAI